MPPKNKFLLNFLTAPSRNFFSFLFHKLSLLNSLETMRSYDPKILSWEWAVKGDIGLEDGFDFRLKSCILRGIGKDKSSEGRLHKDHPKSSQLEDARVKISLI
jgi:hypothetical protein